MATGILGLGSSGSTGLSQEFIDKLKAAEAKAKIDPYTTKLETWDKELEKITEIETKTKELLAAIASFDLYSSTPNAFEQMSATTSGTAAMFNALDSKNLAEGVTTIKVEQLAQRDVYQTVTFTDKTALIVDGQDPTDAIVINGKSFLTAGKTYEELAEEIDKETNIIATVEQVGDAEYRMVIKSEKSGLENALAITQSGVDLGLEVPANKVLSAQNMKATIDEIEYNISSNTITTQSGLIINAVEIGNASISIQRDTSAIVTGLDDFVAKYNELRTLIETEQFSEESSLTNVTSLKMMMDTIKNTMFGEYGADSDKNVFNYGFSFDLYGQLSIDGTILSKAITDDFDGLKSLMVGTAEKPGFGTVLKEYIDDLDGYDGILTQYGTSMADNKTKLEADKTKAQELLDSKYSLMSQQFASYTALITQMEASFGGMKMMIEQSTSGG